MFEPKLPHEVFECPSREFPLLNPKGHFNLLNNLPFEFIRKETSIPGKDRRIRAPCRIHNPLGEPMPQRGLWHIETASQIGEEPSRLANLELSKYTFDPGNIPIIRPKLSPRNIAALISQILISDPARRLVLQDLGPSLNRLLLVFFFELLVLLVRLRHEILIVFIVIIAFGKPCSPKAQWRRQRHITQVRQRELATDRASKQSRYREGRTTRKRHHKRLAGLACSQWDLVRPAGLRAHRQNEVPQNFRATQNSILVVLKSLLRSSSQMTSPHDWPDL
jgi:hypothetical protein